MLDHLMCKCVLVLQKGLIILENTAIYFFSHIYKQTLSIEGVTKYVE